jgi:DNA invertase Pin-like site-specific DNA recombinase
MNKSVACYVRVSTAGQKEAGQREAIERWLTGNGIDPTTAKWYVDKKSGKDLNRPHFQEMQAAVFNGAIGTIVVYKLDRIARKAIEGLKTLADWCDRGLRVVAVTQLIDFNGAVGKMVATLLFGVAEMENDLRRERQAEGIAAAKKVGGVFKGRKPGSTKHRDGPKRAKELRAKGATTAEIARNLGVSRRTVFEYLKV